MAKSSKILKIKEKILSFLDLDNVDRIAIITDNDEDGLTAAINGKLFFEENGIAVKVFFYDHSKRESKYFVKPFVEFNPNKTLFFDLNENFVFDIVNDLNGALKDFVVIDHHKGVELVNISQNYLVIKPNDFSDIEPSKYPASKMVFDIFGGREWITGIGVIGDFAFDKWGEFIKSISNKDFTKEELFDIAEICSCIVSMHSDLIPELFDFLIKINNPLDLINSKFAKLNLKFQNLLNFESMRVKTDGEFIDGLDLIFFKTKKHLPSKLSNRLSLEYPKKTIVVYVVEEDYLKVSFRRQDFLVDCSELAKFSVNGFVDASGGGHIPASAAKMPKKYFLQFKNNVIKYLQSNYKK